MNLFAEKYIESFHTRRNFAVMIN